MTSLSNKSLKHVLKHVEAALILLRKDLPADANMHLSMAHKRIKEMVQEETQREDAEKRKTIKERPGTRRWR